MWRFEPPAQMNNGTENILDTYIGVILSSDYSELSIEGRWSPWTCVVVSTQRVLRIYEESVIGEQLLVNTIHNHLWVSSANQKWSLVVSGVVSITNNGWNSMNWRSMQISLDIWYVCFYQKTIFEKFERSCNMHEKICAFFLNLFFRCGFQQIHQCTKSGSRSYKKWTADTFIIYGVLLLGNTYEL